MKMTSEEFSVKESELLSQLPPEFRALASYHAYNRGHSAGREEVLCILKGFIAELKEPIKNYTDRLVATQEVQKKLVDACEYGMGFPVDSNVLLHNAGQILKEYGSGNDKEHLVAMGNNLITKGEMEYQAVKAFNKLDKK